MTLLTKILLVRLFFQEINFKWAGILPPFLEVNMLNSKLFKKIRVLLRMRQQDFAEILGCSIYTVQSIECGRLGISKKNEIIIYDYLKKHGHDDIIAECFK